MDEWPHLDEFFKKGPCGRGPHQIKISPYDPEKHVWIIDDQLHMIYRFTYDGKLVHSKGELGVRGRGPNTFDRPTDIAWLPDGTYFITDGYGGTRVAKYDAKDNFITDWGQAPADPKNPGPNEFNTVHSIAISADRRLFVVDRGHARMQVFDENGKFLDMWTLRSPHWPSSQNTLMVNHYIDQNGSIWVGDSPTSRILKFDLDGNYLYSWGAPGPQPGRLACSHGMTTDQLGNLYLADCFAGRIQKFEPIANADPEKIARPILRTWEPGSATDESSAVLEDRFMRLRVLILLVLAAWGAMASDSSAQGAGPVAIPRTADGKPDFSGIWQAMNTASWDIQAHAAQKGVPGGPGVVEGNEIPYQPWALAKKKENYAQRATLDPDTKCYLPGIPRLTYMPFPFQIVQTADEVIMLYQYVHAVRYIFMKGEHPKGPIDWWLGDARGRWEGDTLVVDIVHFNDQTWFDKAGNFHSDALHLVERYTPIGPDHIQYTYGRGSESVHAAVEHEHDPVSPQGEAVSAVRLRMLRLRSAAPVSLS